MDYTHRQFEQLYKTRYRPMYRLAYALVENADDARDVVGQVFATLWETRPELPDECLTAWLLTTVRNQCIRLIHQRCQHEEMELQLALQQPEDDAHRELIQELNELIDTSLTPRAREILTLHFDHELSYRETAEALGVSVSTVNKHITHSLAILRKKMNEDEGKL